MSKIIYDITYLFTRRFLSPQDRTTDQMVQAARSGKQNIVEGSKAATTSMETQIKLTNVAKASLQELLEDYEDYLRVRDLSIWDKDSEKAMQTREFCATHLDDAYYRQAVKVRSDETVANIAIILIHQADVLLQGLLNSQQREFLENGGIREQMSQARRQWRSGRPASVSEQHPSTPSAPSTPSTRQGSLTLAETDSEAAPLPGASVSEQHPSTPSAPSTPSTRQGSLTLAKDEEATPRQGASVSEQHPSAPSTPSALSTPQGSLTLTKDEDVAPRQEASVSEQHPSTPSTPSTQDQ